MVLHTELGHNEWIAFDRQSNAESMGREVETMNPSRWRNLAAAFLVVGVVATPVAAQEGERPDFSGVWTTYRGGGGPGAFNSDGGGQPGLTELAQEKVAAYRAVTEGTNHSPGAYCVGSGMPGSMTGSGGYPMEVLQHPRQINITYEAHKEIRRVYIGDHGFNQEGIFPERNGFSVGRWEGDTLVVETTHLMEQVDSRTPHSEQAHIIERYSLGEENGVRVITNEWTMTDPLFLTEPMTGIKRWQALEGGRLLNYECTEPQWADIVARLMAGEIIGYEGE